LSYILIDSNEPSEIERELKLRGIETRRERLPIGDFIVGRNLIERKSYSDLVTSLNRGRLYYQIGSLLEAKKSGYRCILIIENLNFRPIPIGLLVRLIELEVFPLELNERKKLIEILASLSQRSKKKSDRPRLPFLKSKKKLSLKERKKELLRCIPGVGSRKAELLLDNFDSIKELSNANLEELRKVVGITLAKRILETLTK